MIINKMLKQIEGTNNYMKKLEILSELINEVNELVKVNNISKCEVETIIETLEDESLEVRICTNCGELMEVGYVVNGGDEYYCSDECLHEEYTEKEWLEEVENNEDSYWTEWN